MNKKGNPSLRLIDKVKLGSGLSPFTLVTRSSSHPQNPLDFICITFGNDLGGGFPIKKTFPTGIA